MVDVFGKRIFIDSSPIIYHFEGSVHFANALTELFLANEQGDFDLITSTITLTEVLTQPFRTRDFKLIERYKLAFTNSKFLNLIVIGPEIAEKAAELRSNYKLKTPDAIQLATAMDQECDLFLTHDLRLQKITEIEVLTLDQL